MPGSAAERVAARMRGDSLPPQGMLTIRHARNGVTRHARCRGVMKILVVGGLALALPVTPNVARAESATVSSGVKSEITSHMSADSQCNPHRVAIEILTAPANGTLTTEPKNIVIPPVTPRAGQQAPQCIGKTVLGVAIFYQSKPGFVGQDGFKYRRTTPDVPNDRSTGDISYTVTVK
jgi:hypothetical protein